MNSKDFIKDFIVQIVEKFPYIHCSYEYDAVDISHTIEISPEGVFNSNEDFKLIWKRF